MRPYNAIEQKNVKFLVDKQIDFVTLQIFETGYKKSIMDAIAPVRAYFKEKGIHDYEYQLQGTEHKRLVDTYLLNETTSISTKTSLYRPVTKKGDPRLWINHAKEFNLFKPNDIFALIAHEGILYSVNLTSVDIQKVCISVIDTPLKNVINKIAHIKLSVSDELLALIKDNMTDWLPSEVMADTGIGRTIESILGISMNSSALPDYKGIELKSHREAAKVRNTLFTQAPDWSISRLKSSRAIVDKYGYPIEDSKRKTLQVTLSSNRPNPQKLGLRVEPEKGILEANEFDLTQEANGNFRKLNDVAAWTLMKLHERLLTKHHETFWIDVETKIFGNKEFFRCSEIVHTKNPIPAQFDVLLEQGEITVDFLLCRPSGHGDTYSFKIKQRARQLLFPQSSTYHLIV